MSLYGKIHEACTKMGKYYCVGVKTPLKPVGGFSGNKIMPPTYFNDNPGAKKGEHKYHREERLGNSDQLDEVVVLDSYASCANRLETAVLENRDEVPFPLVGFSLEDDGCRVHYNTMNLPHRIFSAHFKNTKVGKKSFMESEYGVEGVYSHDDVRTMRNVFKLNPFAILLGCWRSHVEDIKSNRSRPYRKSRALTMEIFGGVKSTTTKSGGVMMPFDVAQEAYLDFKKKPDDAEDADGKSPKPSETGLASATPSLTLGGVSVDWIVEKMTISVNSLYEYNTGDKKRDASVRAMLFCMGLYAHQCYVAHPKGRGFLRSGCSLAPVEDGYVEKYAWNYNEGDEFTLTLEEASKLYLDAAEEVANYDNGLTLNLEPDDVLIALWKSGFGSKKVSKGKKKSKKNGGDDE